MFNKDVYIERRKCLKEDLKSGPISLVLQRLCLCETVCLLPRGRVPMLL